MTTQGPSTNVQSQIDVGNCIVYIAPQQTSFTNCASSTKWRKLGLLKNGAQLQSSKEKLEFWSGTPLRKQKVFYVREDLRLTGEMLEFSAVNLNRALGNPGITVTTKVSPSTTISGTPSPTKTGFTVASATGLVVDKELEVTSGGTKQYGVIKSINGNAVTLYEALDGDITPSSGDAVKLVDTKAIVLGALSAPGQVALKVEKTLVSNFYTLDCYIPTAEAASDVTFGWNDGAASLDGVGIAFQFDAISDPNVESGALAQILFSQS